MTMNIETAPTFALHDQALTQERLERLAALFAWKMRPGWAFLLKGDLGAGKSTFARALIRAALRDPLAEVPSPTFALVQSYDTPRLALHHYDLYRIEHPSELHELGIDEALTTGVTLIEWPGRAPNLSAPDTISVSLDECVAEPDLRDVAITATGTQSARALERIAAIDAALADWTARTGDAIETLHFLQGDASARSYARMTTSAGRSFLVMDAPAAPDGPPVRDGKPYSQIAHLAEDIKSFVAIAHGLRAAGLSAPAIAHAAVADGILIIEDLGDDVFGARIAAAQAHGQTERRREITNLWTPAVDALVALRIAHPSHTISTPNGTNHTLPAFDKSAMQIEVDLFLDWYWPAMFAQAPSPQIRAEFEAAWAPVFEELTSRPAGWVLRDYHSPNLIWLPDRIAPANVGIIDFQDAMAGDWSYDLVSLLQDARLTVPADVEHALFEHYCARCNAGLVDFDHTATQTAYAAFGAQRATKIIGIFARLAMRDAKPGYLAHLPRMWGYLERNLSAPHLRALAAWYERRIPNDIRSQTPQLS